MENITLLINYIAKDMMEPIGYLPWGLLSGCIFLLILTLWRRFNEKSAEKNTLKRDLVHFLLIAYCITLLKLAFFSREPGSRTDVSMRLFDTWGTTMQTHAFFIENILMFLPFGILVPTVFQETRGVLRCTVTAFACSTLLEMIQLVTGRGFCQIDDVITNTVGGLVGYALYRGWQWVRARL